MHLAFLYEHPNWSAKLLACFADLGIHITPINIAELRFDSSQWTGDFDAVINRINIMPSTGRDPSVVFHTLHFLRWLELQGIPLLNGADAHYAGSSKALQNGIFAKLGLGHPRAIAIHTPSQALAAGRDIGYPLIVKPNIGGSGNGIEKFDNSEDLTLAIQANTLTLGVDGTGLIQEYIESDGFIYRVEILGDQLFYAIRQQMVSGRFNYCAIDGCNTSDVDEANLNTDNEFAFCTADTKPGIEVFQPAPEIIEYVVAINQLAGAEVGGVEYLIDQKTGNPCFYDFNPYSNFVAEGAELLGFSPELRYVEYIKTWAATHGVAHA